MQTAKAQFAEAIAAKERIESQLEDAIETCRAARERVYALCEHVFVMERLYDHKSYTCKECGYER
jgi:hypothetical protein